MVESALRGLICYAATSRLMPSWDAFGRNFQTYGNSRSRQKRVFRVLDNVVQKLFRLWKWLLELTIC